MITVSMTAFNRPWYLRETLHWMAQNKMDGIECLYASIEPSEHQSVVYNTINSVIFTKTDIVVNETLKKPDRNMHDVIDRAFASGSEFNIHFDDDMFISPDAFNLARWYFKIFKENQHAYFSYGLFNYNSDPSRPSDIVRLRKFFPGLGYCMFREQWYGDWKDVWFSDIAGRIYGPTARGWDWNMSAHCIDKNLSCLMPVLSRTNHLGVIGTDCNEQYQAQHFSKLVPNTTHDVVDFILEEDR